MSIRYFQPDRFPVASRFGLRCTRDLERMPELHLAGGRTHGYSLKYALEFADANAAQDGSPLVICSDLPEADFQSMPTGPASESVLFAPLSYYKVRAAVVPMPRALNEQAGPGPFGHGERRQQHPSTSGGVPLLRIACSEPRRMEDSVGRDSRFAVTERDFGRVPEL